MDKNEPLIDMMGILTDAMNRMNANLQLINKSLVEIKSKLDVRASPAPPESPPHAIWGQITITSIPTLIKEANPNRKEIVVTNSSSTTLFVGTSDQVTTETGDNPGYEVLAQGSFYGDYKGDIYGVIETGSVTITYWEE